MSAGAAWYVLQQMWRDDDERQQRERRAAELARYKIEQEDPEPGAVTYCR